MNRKPIKIKKMLYVQHWSFKTGCHQKGAEKFLGGGGDYPGVEMIGRYHASYSNNVYIIVQASAGIKMTEHFAPWKVKFDIDFDIKPVMTDEEKVAEHLSLIHI